MKQGIYGLLNEKEKKQLALRVASVVANHLGENIFLKTKKQNVANARHIARYVMFWHYPVSMNTVAIQTIGCNHSITYNSLKEAKNLLETNAFYARKYLDIRKELGVEFVHKKIFRKKNALTPAVLVTDKIKKFR